MTIFSSAVDYFFCHRALYYLCKSYTRIISRKIRQFCLTLHVTSANAAHHSPHTKKETGGCDVTVGANFKVWLSEEQKIFVLEAS